MMKENKQICRPCTIYIYAQKLGTCRLLKVSSFTAVHKMSSFLIVFGPIIIW